MGAPFSALDKHVGCYNFGVGLSAKAASRKYSSQWMSSSSLHSSCTACQATSPNSSGTRDCYLLPVSCANQHCSTSANPLSQIAEFTPSSLVPTSGAAGNAAFHASPPRSAFLETQQFSVTTLDSVIMREPLLKPVTTSTRDTECETRMLQKQRSALNRKFLNYLQRKTGIKKAMKMYASQFNELIHSWSLDELYQLQCQFEALELLKSVTIEASEARLNAPTLNDDLRKLIETGWCHNIQVSYGQVVRGAHSYILAARSQVFSKVLHAVYRTLFNKVRSSSFLPVISIVVPDQELYCMDCSHSKFTPIRLENSPDVLRSTNAREYIYQQRHGPKRDSKRCPTSSNTHQEPLMRKQNLMTPAIMLEVTVLEFLTEVYAGRGDQSLPLLVEEPREHPYSPGKPKPDLLCLPETPTKIACPSDLSSLYLLLNSTHPESPLAPDCQLTFSCENSPPCCHLLNIKCHAGLLAARSKFLRRLLQRRYQPQYCGCSTGRGLTSVLFDGRIIKPDFGEIIVHFFYSDRLDINAIARVPYARSTQCPAVKVNCTVVEKTVSMHIEWHSAHATLSAECRPLPCCIGYSEANKHNENHAQIPIESTKSSQLKFCLTCPYCLARVLELHPIGHYLEFPRLSEACEDIVIQALHWSTVINHQKDVTPRKNVQDQSFNENYLSTVDSISLAVGLLHWADSSYNKLSPSSSSVESIPTQPLSFTQGNVESTHAPPKDAAPGRGLSALPQPEETKLCNESTATRYLRLQAVQSLRANFLLLARRPTILGRLTPRHLREILDSNLVQAPEMEVLAALLCWAEERLRSSNYGPSTFSDYPSLVSLIAEPASSGSADNNPWLLLGLGKDIGFPSWLEISSYTQTEERLESTKCDLCPSVDEHLQSFSELLSFRQVNMENLMKKLHKSQLLEFIRPMHFLSPIPLGLATLMLRFHFGVKRKFCWPFIDLAKLSGLSDNPNSLSALEAADFIHLDDWSPLLKTSMMLLSHQESKGTLPHPVLVRKLGDGPHSALPPTSPAQVSYKSSWLTTFPRSNLSTSLRKFPIPCSCRWSRNILQENINKSSSLGNRLNQRTSFPSMRLFYPFLNQIRTILASRSLNSTPIRASTSVGVAEPRCTCIRLLSALSASYTPTHPSFISSPSCQKRVPIGLREPSPITVSPQKTSVEAKDMTLGWLNQPCCSPSCTDVADCLLQPQEWSSLVNRYFTLAENFDALYSNSWLSSFMTDFSLLYRLRVLREQGLPDRLQSLLSCRINDSLYETSLQDHPALQIRFQTEQKNLKNEAKLSSSFDPLDVHLDRETKAESSCFIPKSSANHDLKTSSNPYDEVLADYGCLACQVDKSNTSFEKSKSLKETVDRLCVDPNEISPCFCEVETYPTDSMFEFSYDWNMMKSLEDNTALACHMSRRPRQTSTSFDQSSVFTTATNFKHTSTLPHPHTFDQAKRTVRRSRMAGHSDRPIARCSCPYLGRTGHTPHYFISGPLDRTNSRIAPSRGSYTACDTVPHRLVYRRSKSSPTSFTTLLSSSGSYRSSSDLTGCSHSTADLSEAQC